VKKASILVTPKRDSVLVDLKDVPQKVVLEFAQNFGIDPPDCAKPFIGKMKDENYLMFFRKNVREK
jgi:beta-phosphoglucomutase-like phosphatase (HAD superfamily)